MPLLTTQSAKGYGFSQLVSSVATSSYESIATALGTGSSGTITFSSIPATFKHLQLRIMAQGNGPGGYPTSLASFRLNGDTGSNYATHNMIVDNTVTTTQAGNSYPTSTAGDFFYLPGADSSFYGNVIIDILDYANTNKKKVLRNIAGSDRNGSAAKGRVAMNSMMWNSTAAINSITIVGDSTYHGNWSTDSSFALYGIKG
jgi:hypothetical protein